ncbi:uncharacterized protein METZ01_LOCUS489898, partial [marine metagenome]
VAAIVYDLAVSDGLSPPIMTSAPMCQ